MALFNCSECGYEFSDKAPACPKCGYPNTPGGMTPITPPPKSAAKKKRSGCTGCLIALLIPFSVGVVSTVVSEFLPEPTPEELAAQKAEREEKKRKEMNDPGLVARLCGNRIKTALKRPYSYQFEKLVYRGFKGQKAGVNVRFAYSATNDFNARMTYVGSCESKRENGKWTLIWDPGF